jgi:spore germination cell wall hydrolase CwlJ-like protein
VKGENTMEKFVRLGSYLLGFLMVTMIVQTVTTTKFQNLRERSGYYSADVMTIKTAEKQLDCLAMNIYREAGYEPFEGKVAVAQVTINRMNHPAFPKDVCGVVHQKSVIMDRVVCQFSWHCDSAARTRPVNKAAYNESYAVAKKVFLENFRLDVLKDALYYHADYVNPQWGLPKIGKIGQHIFYREKDRRL